MSTIYQKENEIQDVKDAQIRECQLRVLKVTPGGDPVCIGLLRLPSNFEHQFSTDDSFLVDFTALSKRPSTWLQEETK